MDVMRSPVMARVLWTAMQATAPLSSNLSGRLASRIWFTPWPVPIGERGAARRQSWLRDSRPIRFDTRHGEVRGFAQGEGPVVLLVHGWGDTAASLGAFISPLDEAGYKVVGIDLPGHGASVRIEPTVYALAEALEDVVTATGGIHGIVAHSFGAVVTLMAVRTGLQVEKLTLISPPSSLRDMVSTFSKLLRVPASTARGMGRHFERRFGPQIWDELTAHSLTKANNIPTLIVHDRGDTQTPFDAAEELAASWPTATFIATEGLGHGRILRDEAVLTAVTRSMMGTRSTTPPRSDLSRV